MGREKEAAGRVRAIRLLRSQGWMHKREVLGRWAGCQSCRAWEGPLVPLP